MRDIPLPGQRYKHHRRGEVRVITIAREYDLGVDFVVHTDNDGNTWARTVANFLGDRDGELRFEGPLLRSKPTTPPLDDEIPF